MGTRNLIAIAKGNGYKLAQYNQWDGYLTGQGNGILAFFNTPGFDLETFKNKVDNLYFGDEDEINAIWDKFSTNGMMTRDQSKAFQKSEYGYLSRDTGSDILSIIAASNGPMLVQNSIDFAKDSLFCEFAYVIDLNRNVLELYQGFNQEPLDPIERFYSAEPDKDGYYPVKLIREISLFDLPESFDELDKELYSSEDEDGDE